MPTQVNETEDRIDRLEEAKRLLLEAYELLDGVAKETDDRYRHRYIVDPLRCMIDNDHSFLVGVTGASLTVEAWIEKLQNPEDE